MKSNIHKLIKFHDPLGYEESIMTYDSAVQFRNDIVVPMIKDMERTDRTPKELWELLGAQGYLGMTVPQTIKVNGKTFDLGGSDMGYFKHGLVAQALSKSGAVGLSYIAHSNLCINQIKLNGTPEQQIKYLPKLCSGEYVGALAMSEAGAGSDVIGGMLTKAEKIKGGYRLNGSKMWITNGGIADVIVLYTKTPQEDGTQGVTAFIVDLTTDKVGFTPIKKEDKMGMRGSETWQIEFKDFEISDDQVLRGPNLGGRVLMSGLNYERILLSFGALGLASCSLEDMLKYTQEREQFDRALAANQGPAHDMSKMWSSFMQTTNYVYSSAIMADRDALIENVNERFVTNELAASVFLEAADTVSHITDQAILRAGGYGYTKDFDFERYARDAKLYQIGGGARDIRLEIIARGLLPKYNENRKLFDAFLKNDEAQIIVLKQMGLVA